MYSIVTNGTYRVKFSIYFIFILKEINTSKSNADLLFFSFHLPIKIIYCHFFSLILMI